MADRLRWVLPVSLLLLAGCDLTRFTASSSAALFVRGGEGTQEHWDYEMIGDALPASILQLEGVFRVVPDNEDLGVALMRAYISYAFGWVEDEMADAQDAGDFDEEERLTTRARLLYLRARNVGLHLLRQKDEDVEDVLQGSPQEVEAYLERRFTSRDDVPVLFWTGYAWGSAINAGQVPELVVELSTARALVERAVALDPAYYDHSGFTFLGALNAAPGGDVDQAREYFERALRETDRQFFTVHVTYARTYAVRTLDRDLFVTLLREVIDGGDPLPRARLANRIARRQALRYLSRVDQYFD
jgi:tetratricopeptide (TPR) repeat protein